MSFWSKGAQREPGDPDPAVPVPPPLPSSRPPLPDIVQVRSLIVPHLVRLKAAGATEECARRVAALCKVDDSEAALAFLQELEPELTANGLTAEALTVLDRALGIAERLHGTYDVRVAAPLRELGRSRLAARDPAGAAELFQRALAIYMANRDELHVADTAGELGRAYLDAEMPSAAEEWCRVAVDRAMRVRGADDERTAGAVGALSAALTLGNRQLEALQCASYVFDYWWAHERPHGVQLARACEARAVVETRLGDAAAAEDSRRLAVQVLEDAGGVAPMHLAAALEHLAGSVSGRGDDGEAVALLHRALAELDLVLAPDHGRHVPALMALAFSLARLERYAEAEPVAHRAHRLCAASMGPTHPTALFLHKLHGQIAVHAAGDPSTS